MSMELAPSPQGERARRLLAAVGRATRARSNFLLQLAALAWGVVREAVRPSAWRRTVRAEFRRVLRHAAGGGLIATLFTAALVGLVMVSQALYWLGAAGEEALVGPVLVTALVREVTPLLIGLILLGRNGVVAIIELGTLQLGGQSRVIAGQGLDMFALLVLPRAVAFAVGSFTLGVIFVLVALLVGFIAGSLLGAVQTSLWQFLDRVVTAMEAQDFALFPAKMLAIGLAVALVACLTGLSAGPRDHLAELLPRAFVRGVLAIMTIDLVLSLAV